MFLGSLISNLLSALQNFQIEDGGSKKADICLIQKYICLFFLYCCHSLRVLRVTNNESSIGIANLSKPRWWIQNNGPMFDAKMYLSVISVLWSIILNFQLVSKTKTLGLPWHLHVPWSIVIKYYLPGKSYKSKESLRIFVLGITRKYRIDTLPL